MSCSCLKRRPWATASPHNAGLAVMGIHVVPSVLVRAGVWLPDVKQSGIATHRPFPKATALSAAPNATR